MVALSVLVLAGAAIAQAHRASPQPANPIPYAQPVTASPPYRKTWYDAMLKQFNPNNLDWGQWIEERRAELLNETARNPYFKYGLVTTLLLALLALAYAKALIDKSRVKWLANERYNDLLRQDRRSRAEAHAAIQRYNTHMEMCNRAVEAEFAKHNTPNGSCASAGTGVADPEEKLVRLADAEREHAAIQAKLEMNSAAVADLAARLNEIGSADNGAAKISAQQPGPRTGTAELTRMVGELQEQLYLERERNKRLKGA